jgi:hypothetical protein
VKSWAGDLKVLAAHEAVGEDLVMTRQKGERPADIKFWLGDGLLASYEARVTADTEVSIGRTDSKRAVGFIVSKGETKIDFVLDRDQAEQLAAYLQLQLSRLLKPLGRKKSQLNFAVLARQAVVEDQT